MLIHVWVCDGKYNIRPTRLNNPLNTPLQMIRPAEKLMLLKNRARTGVPGGAAPLGWWMRRNSKATLSLKYFCA
jgi:hypothetical protein